MNIETNRQVKIFSKDGEYGKFYSTGISEKKEDGSYNTSYVTVQFKKGTEPDGDTNIYIKNAWLKPMKDNKVKIFINEYETVEETAHRELNNSQLVAQVMQTEVEEDIDLSTIEISDDDLPF